MVAEVVARVIRGNLAKTAQMVDRAGAAAPPMMKIMAMEGVEPLARAMILVAGVKMAVVLEAPPVRADTTQAPGKQTASLVAA